MSAHSEGYCDSTRCSQCAADELDTCEDCGDPIPEGEGCAHEGRYCAACFTQRCGECLSDLADDLAAEAAEDMR